LVSRLLHGVVLEDLHRDRLVSDGRPGSHGPAAVAKAAIGIKIEVVAVELATRDLTPD
jgi:hypothetical protein